jgi:hypothetical protein
MGRVKAALGATSLTQVAEALGEPLSTVKSWSARDAVPLGALRRIKAQTGRSIDWLIYGDETQKSSSSGDAGRVSKSDTVVASSSAREAFANEAPRRYGEQGPDEDPFSKRLATAMDIVDAGLATNSVDASKVPRAEMAAAVFRLLPWPIPLKE